MRMFISLSVTGIGMGLAVWVRRKQRWLKSVERQVKAALPGHGRDQMQPCSEIQDLPTLLRVTSGPETLAWIGSHVTSLVVRDAGADLPYIHPLVGAMTSLVKLDMSQSTVHYLPFFVSNLVSIQAMSFSGCELNFIPMEIGQMVSLTTLDLSRNQLPILPPALCNLTSLVSLNVMGNQLTQLPEDVGCLTNLRILGIKSNRLAALPDSFTRLTSLMELFITDNKLVTLPTGFGSLTSLVKLQASFNSFTSLPPDLVNLPHLELMRVAVCSLNVLPPALLNLPAPRPLDEPLPGTAAPDGGTWLNASSMAEGSAGIVGPPTGPGVLPSLAWCSLSGNGACASLPRPRPGLKHYQSSDLAGGVCGDKLGDGASGEVRLATLAATGEQVAVKIFRADVSPDGRTEEEVGIACAVDHPNLTQVIGVLPPESPELEASSSSSPPPAPTSPPRLVMRLVNGKPLAAKPTSEHLLRCKWAPGTDFTLAQCLSIAEGVAAGLEHMHQHSICHGDVYAHNILVDADTSQATLCDFGASFCYHPDERFWQAMEVRAYGLFLKDVVDRLVGVSGAQAHALMALVNRCTQAPASQRPTFTDIKLVLHAMRPTAIV